MTLLRLLLRTKQWFTVVAALLVGNAVTNVLPAGDVAGAGVQYQMLAMVHQCRFGGRRTGGRVDHWSRRTVHAAGVRRARDTRGLPVSPGLEHAAYLGLAGFVLIVAFAPYC